jgi:YHS domain-containing protein
MRMSMNSNKPVKGSDEYRTEFKGSIFHFASKANRDAFVADPTSYAPQYGGFCAFGLAGGYKAATDPAAFSTRRRQAPPQLRPRDPKAMEHRRS